LARLTPKCPRADLRPRKPPRARGRPDVRNPPPSAPITPPMRVELEPFGVVVRWPGTGLALLVDVTGGAV